MTAFPLQAELAGRLDRPQVGCPAVDDAARTQLQAMWPDVVEELGRLAAAVVVLACWFALHNGHVRIAPIEWTK